MKWCLRRRRAIGPVEGHITNLWKRRSAIQILRHRSRKLLPYALSMGQRCHGLDQQRSFGQQHLFQRPQRMAHPIGRTGILWRDRLHWYFYHNPYGSAKKTFPKPGVPCCFPGTDRLPDLFPVYFSTCIIHTLCLCPAGHGRGCFM